MGKFEELCRLKCRNLGVEYSVKVNHLISLLRTKEKKAKTCRFGELKDSMIRDLKQLFSDLSIKYFNHYLIREKLLKAEKLDLKRAISVYKTNELVKRWNKKMSQGEGLVNADKREEISRDICPGGLPGNRSKEEIPHYLKEHLFNTILWVLWRYSSSNEVLCVWKKKCASCEKITSFS